MSTCPRRFGAFAGIAGLIFLATPAVIHGQLPYPAADIA
jgi:hypothetical protein